MKIIDLYALIFILTLSPMLAAEVIGRPVSYQANGVSLQGYLVSPSGSQDKMPAVLVVHEWWGHNQYARRRAEMLAELGYVALALDMYGEGKVASHPDDAKKFMQEALSDPGALTDRFLAALAFVRSLDNVDTSNIAAIGYCFGGGVVLNMARMGIDLKGVVSFHGSLVTNSAAEKDAVNSEVLVFHGANDAFITQQQLAQFEQKMKSVNASYQVIVYEGVEHSFTNPEADMFAEKFSMPLSYDEEADTDSWEKMQLFFKRIFR